MVGFIATFGINKLIFKPGLINILGYVLLRASQVMYEILEVGNINLYLYI